jgi:hypothetical protein
MPVSASWPRISVHTLCWLSASISASADDRVELLGRRQPVDRAGLDLLELLPHQAGDADHEELVEVRTRDREEAQPLEQRMRGIARLLHHAAVEGEPAQLAIEVTYAILRRFGHLGPFDGLLFRCLGHRR